jgi:hypothetical protein
MKRARNLDDVAISRIISILDGWHGRLTWHALIDEVEKVLNERYTRQGLAKHPSIADNFARRKRRRSSTKKARFAEADSPALQAALQKIELLEEQNRRLQHEYNNCLLQFATWLTNAQAHGLTKDQLNRPLDRVNRETSRTATSSIVASKPKKTKWQAAP